MASNQTNPSSNAPRFTSGVLGHCSNNGRPDALARYENRMYDAAGPFTQQSSGPVPGRQTNQRAAQEGTLQAMKDIRDNIGFPNAPGERVQVKTNSEYVTKGMNEYGDKWLDNGYRNARNKPLVNADKFQEMHAVKDDLRQRGWDVDIAHDSKVKGTSSPSAGPQTNGGNGIDGPSYGTPNSSSYGGSNAGYGAGYGNSGYGNFGYGNSGYPNSGYGNSGYGSSGDGNPGYGNPGYGYGNGDYPGDNGSNGNGYAKSGYEYDSSNAPSTFKSSSGYTGGGGGGGALYSAFKSENDGYSVSNGIARSIHQGFSEPAEQTGGNGYSGFLGYAREVDYAEERGYVSEGEHSDDGEFTAHGGYAMETEFVEVEDAGYADDGGYEDDAGYYDAGEYEDDGGYYDD